LAGDFDDVEGVVGLAGACQLDFQAFMVGSKLIVNNRVSAGFGLSRPPAVYRNTQRYVIFQSLSLARPD
jgi:hypothetical protein